MSRTIHYRQCHLVCKTEAGEMHLTSWIDESFAVVGKKVKVWEGEGWSVGWEVVRVGSTRMADDELPDPHQGVKAHRKATGDSMRK
jgi:hypothetical protein